MVGWIDEWIGEDDDNVDGVGGARISSTTTPAAEVVVRTRSLVYLSIYLSYDGDDGSLYLKKKKKLAGDGLDEEWRVACGVHPVFVLLLLLHSHHPLFPFVGYAVMMMVYITV